MDTTENQSPEAGLPTRNYRSGSFGFENAKAIGAERYFDELLRGTETGDQLKQGRETCYSCAVRCKRVVEAEWQEKAINPCLLYTSDAADDLTRVDLGG